ncbi:MAG: hypothetical protein IJ751_06750 [Oscillospiraceae bacterium]|nr:hypothetical protein [Oscillospiraceae bacterium]
MKEVTLAVLRSAPSIPSQKTPRQRFHAYCIRVGVSVAAALLLLFGTVPLGSLVSRHGAEVSQAAQLQLPMPSLPDLSLPEVTLPDLGERFRSADDHFRSFQSHFSLNHMGENEHESHD